MSSIVGVDDRPEFFSINQDNNSSEQINENKIESSGADPADHNSDFQIRLQSLIDGLVDHEANPLDNHAPNDTMDPAPISAVNNKDSLLSLLEPNIDNIETQNSAEPISSMPYSRMITKYKQAMHDFRNAFNLSSSETPDGLNIHPVNRIGSGERDATPNSSKIDSVGVNPIGVNPSKEQIVDYITGQCKQIGIPAQLGLATAVTESDLTQFDKNGGPFRHSNPDSTDWGIMQINDKAWGDTYDFNRIKSDWKYNIRAGLQVLKTCFDAALNNNEANKGTNNSFQNLARAAYSGYNAGITNLGRYRTPIDNAVKTASYDVINNEGYDLRDIQFWNNYRKLS